MTREIMYRDALKEAIDEEMQRDPTVFIIGEGIAERGGSYKVTEGLLAKYGPKRVRDTPIAEAGMIGVGVGAAIAGARPIVEILYVDFAMLGMDMLVNQAAKFRLMTGGDGRVPFVMRTQGGTGGGVAAQHSQSLEALFYHIPGLKVVMPSVPADAKGLLKYALRQPDPVMFLEHKHLYMTKGPVPDGEHIVEFGKADIKRPGKDVTIIAWSNMIPRALEAAGKLAEEGIDAEVLDPRTLVPLAEELALARSYAKERQAFGQPLEQLPLHADTLAGLEAGRFEIAYPRRFVAILKSVRALPYPAFFRLMARAVLKAK